jgi:hypothetical protein
MSYELKTKLNDTSPIDFINSIEDETKRLDSHTLLKLFEKVSWEKGKMWWENIIGFWDYIYSNSTGKEFTWMRTGFSPRKASLSLYIMPGYQFEKMTYLLEKLGKHKTSKWWCLYIKKLSDIDPKVLEEIIKFSLEIMKEKYGV